MLLQLPVELHGLRRSVFGWRWRADVPAAALDLAPGLSGGEMIAALYIAVSGPYYAQPGIDPWTEARDARLYTGPHPVVAHPPCERWGRYWSGGPSAKIRRRKGDDNGCFAAALTAVRIWGGVLEHPAHTAAWEAFGLLKPPSCGGWMRTFCGGWVCHVEQGHYGHRARKPTWLYARSTHIPSLIWGPSTGIRLEDGFHSTSERARARCRDQASQTNLRAGAGPYARAVQRNPARNCALRDGKPANGFRERNAR